MMKYYIQIEETSCCSNVPHFQLLQMENDRWRLYQPDVTVWNKSGLTLKKIYGFIIIMCLFGSLCFLSLSAHQLFSKYDLFFDVTTFVSFLCCFVAQQFGFFGRFYLIFHSCRQLSIPIQHKPIDDGVCVRVHWNTLYAIHHTPKPIRLTNELAKNST